MLHELPVSIRQRSENIVDLLLREPKPFPGTVKSGVEQAFTSFRIAPMQRHSEARASGQAGVKRRDMLFLSEFIASIQNGEDVHQFDRRLILHVALCVGGGVTWANQRIP